jgi:SOS-response transcriptional repressor LexA
MTRSQYEVYKAIKKYKKETGENPRIQDICNITGAKSPGSIILHIKNLKESGYIDYTPRKKRTISIVKEYKCKYDKELLI